MDMFSINIRAALMQVTLYEMITLNVLRQKMEIFALFLVSYGAGSEN